MGYVTYKQYCKPNFFCMCEIFMKHRRREQLSNCFIYIYIYGIKRVRINIHEIRNRYSSSRNNCLFIYAREKSLKRKMINILTTFYNIRISFRPKFGICEDKNGILTYVPG